MSHSQGLSNNPYPEPNQPNSSCTDIYSFHSNIVLPPTLGLPKGLFPVDLPVKVLKAPLPSSILATCPTHHHNSLARVYITSARTKQCK